MSRQRTLVYGLVTAVIAAAVIALVGLTVGYGKGEASSDTPSAVAVVDGGSSIDPGSTAVTVRYDDDDRWEDDDEHEGHEDDEHDHDRRGGGGIPAGLFSRDD